MHTICTRTVHVYICISGIGIPCLHRIVSPFFSATFLGRVEEGRKGRGGSLRPIDLRFPNNLSPGK